MLLAINPNRSSTAFSAFRLTGVVAITVTFIVFHVALSLARGSLASDWYPYPFANPKQLGYVKRARFYERVHKNRAGVLKATEREHSNAWADPAGLPAISRQCQRHRWAG